jgi:hypothetical protein
MVDPDRTFGERCIVSLGKSHAGHQALVCNHAVNAAIRIFRMLLTVKSI